MWSLTNSLRQLGNLMTKDEKRGVGQITGADCALQHNCSCSIQSIHFPKHKGCGFSSFTWETKVSSISFENNNGIYLYAAVYQRLPYSGNGRAAPLAQKMEDRREDPKNGITNSTLLPTYYYPYLSLHSPQSILQTLYSTQREIQAPPLELGTVGPSH